MELEVTNSLSNRTETIQVFEHDNPENIIRRIAAAFESLPKYIPITQYDTLLVLSPEGKPVPVVTQDTLTPLRKSGRDSFREVFDKVKGNEKLSFEGDILKVWLAFKKGLDRLPPEQRDAVFLGLTDDVNAAADRQYSMEDLRRLWQESREVQKFIDSQIERNWREAQDSVRFQQKFTDLKGIGGTNQTEVARNLTYRLNDTDGTPITVGWDIMDVFNLLQLNETIPFAAIAPFYKVLHGFAIPDQSWIGEALEEVILVRVKENKKWNTLLIEMDERDVKLTFDSKYQNRVKAAVLSLFKLQQITLEEIELRQVKYRVFYTGVAIDSAIVADMAMNDLLFSTFVYVNESSTLNRISNKSIRLFVHSGGSVSFTNEPLGVSVLITADSDDKASEMAGLVGKLLAYYTANFQRVVDEYRKLITLPNTRLNLPKVEKAKREKPLTTLYPDTFPRNYTRACQFMPIVVSEEEALQRPEEQRMFFPKTPEEGQQRWYVCTGKGDKWNVGLRENKIRDGGKYLKYLPCCIKTDPRQTAVYKTYFEGADKGEEEVLTAIITTHKFVGKDRFGVLPTNLSTVLSMASPGLLHWRRGVVDDPGSFLACLLTVFDPEFIRQTTPNQKEIIAGKRASLTRRVHASVARQEMYDMKPAEIREYVSGDEYLDPKKSLRILEEFFDCNIFLATWDSLILPRHTMGYLGLKKDRRSVCIFVHRGSEPRPTQLPRCELVVQTQSQTNNPVALFSADHPISVALRRFHNTMIKSQYPQQRYPAPSGQPQSQIIDSYGKTRGLVYSKRRAGRPARAVHWVLPMQPLNVPELAISSAGRTLSRFRSLQRASRNIVEAAMFSFRMFCENRGLPVDATSLPVFGEEMFKYGGPEDYYGNHSRRLQFRRILVPDEETRSSVVLMLKRHLEASPEFVREHPSYIVNYYTDADDFEQISGQEVLKSLDENLLLVSPEKDYKIHEDIVPDAMGPYFLRFQGKLYLARNEESKDSALDRCRAAKREEEQEFGAEERKGGEPQPAMFSRGDDGWMEEEEGSETCIVLRDGELYVSLVQK